MQFTEKEIFVVEQRKKGKTLREIGKDIGLSQERVRQIYLAYYRKLSVDRDLSSNWRMLEKESAALGIRYNDLIRMTRILKRSGFDTIRDIRLADKEFVLEIRGIGEKYAEAIVGAAKKCMLTNRR